MITIKEVYDQLPKEDLGTERALFISYGGDHEIGREYYLVGVCRDSEYPYVAKFGNVYNSFTGHHEVKWIGNKPKTKKLKKYLIRYSEHHYSIEYFANDYEAEKYCKYNESHFIKTWETHSDDTLSFQVDQYPTIEEEVGE